MFSQNYQDICTNGLTFYKDNANNIKAFRLDSMYLLGSNDTLFFSYRTIIDTNIYQCYDTTNGSVLGWKIYKKHDGWFFFFNRNHDTVSINSTATLNQTWKFCDLPSNQYIQAKVTSIQSDSILGTTDLVKIITFQAKDNLNNNIFNILNNRTIKLSKHYGLAKMLNVYYIPADTTMYILEGKSSPQVGLQDMTWRNVFDFNVGDVFHYSGYYNFKSIYFKIIKTILAKTITPNHDSIIYTVDYCNNLGSVHDTATEIYDSSDYLNPYSSIGLPQEFQRINDDQAYSFDANLSAYNQRFAKSLYLEFSHFYDTCWHNGFFEIGTHFTFTKGLGKTYYFHVDFTGFEQYRSELVYYEKGNEIWGTPVASDCNELMSISPEKSNSAAVIQIIPNPIENSASVFVRGPGNYYHLSFVLYDYSGKLILKEQINSNLFNLNRGDLPAGLYILALYDTNDVIIGRKKIILR